MLKKKISVEFKALDIRSQTILVMLDLDEVIWSVLYVKKRVQAKKCPKK